MDRSFRGALGSNAARGIAATAPTAAAAFRSARDVAISVVGGSGSGLAMSFFLSALAEQVDRSLVAVSKESVQES